MPEYLLILIVVFLVSFFIHRLSKVTIFISKRHLFIFFGIIFVIGTIWDQLAIGRGHWSFGAEFLVGSYLGLMPIEEYIFMIIVVYFALVIYRITEKYSKY